MSGEAWTFLGIIVTAVGAFAVAMRTSKSNERTADRSASATEVTALGARLDVAVARIERLERRERGLRAYIADDHDFHRSNDLPIQPLPEELA